MRVLSDRLLHANDFKTRVNKPVVRGEKRASFSNLAIHELSAPYHREFSDRLQPA
jgi:hypothetical protein